MEEKISELTISEFLIESKKNNGILEMIKKETNNDNAVIRILALAMRKDNPDYKDGKSIEEINKKIIKDINDNYDYNINFGGNKYHALKGYKESAGVNESTKVKEYIDLEPLSRDCNTIQDIIDILKNKGPFKTLRIEKLEAAFKNTTIKEINQGRSNMENHGVSSRLKKIIRSGVKQIILTGAPGTGKTYIADKLAREYITKTNKLNNDENGAADNKGIDEYISFVQFHPSYDYTDFVEGLRPIETDEGVTFKKVDGIFKKFCREASKKNNSQNVYFFIIDEINRADLSKVFGELMFGLERDKRGKPIQTQYQNMKTFDIEKKEYMEEDIYEESFFIPENVYVIGTMNDIDRSVESMDFALRRRFNWIEVKANDELDEAFNAINEDEKYSFFPEIIDGNINREDFIDRVKKQIISINNYIYKDDTNDRGNGKVNEGKMFLLNQHYHISHGYFSDLPEYIFKGDIDEVIKEVLNYVWNYRLESLISEYVRGENGSNSFIAGCKQAFISLAEETNKDLEDKSSDMGID